MMMHNTETQAVAQFAELAYLNYAMYVIMDRALPHISDGLKPVQRRIVYAMSELGLKASAKPKKSARTIGDVIGKYHPHGDSACYKAMVLMSQPFSYRYPLISGQGNFGSMDDPKSFAAMRYTEAKLSDYASVLLSELGDGTSAWQDNFDGTMQEPITLPARLPNILLNGSTGIAVGMATDIAPHNLGEVVDALVALLKNPNLDTKQIMTYIKAPDLPTGAQIVSSFDDLHAMYDTGKGSYTMRAHYFVDAKHKNKIVIDALPYQVFGKKVIEQIAQIITQKKLPQLIDVLDEADHEHPTRIVLVLRSGRVDAEEVMLHLFATTSLQTNYRVNFNMIGMDNKPCVKPLKTILIEWLSQRKDTVIRRLRHNLDKINERLHIIDALMIAHLHIDTVIEIIRQEDNPKTVLIERFNITPMQAGGILEIRLRQLAKLEYIELKSEQEQLLAQKDNIEQHLDSDKMLTKLIIKELKNDKKTFGDVRRTAVVSRPLAKIYEPKEHVLIEDVFVVLSKAGFIRVSKSEIDVDNLSFRQGDAYFAHTAGKSNQKVYLLDNTGRSYTVSVSDLPSIRTQGDPLTSMLKPAAESHWSAMLMGEKSDKVLLATSAGYGFLSQLQALDTTQKSGKSVLRTDDKHPIVAPLLPSHEYIALITTQARLSIVALDELPELKKGRGNKLLSLDKTEALLGIVPLQNTDTLVIKIGKRDFKLTPNNWQSFIKARAKPASIITKTTQKVHTFYVI